MSQGVAALRTAMAEGRTTSQRVAEACIERIERWDRKGPCLGAILEINPDCVEIAEQLDRERAAGQVRGPLHGIPVVLKANIDTCDRMSTTAGSLALEGSVPPRDAFLVSKLRDAGAVLLGKANLSEWANFRGLRSLSGWSSHGEQTRNPYDARRSPCGSSSGSAVSVAAGFAPLAVGTETDGSIVCPAQTCGVVGIKPTLGAISRSGIVPIAHSQDTAGPMGRTVADAAMLLCAMIGEDPEDPATGGARDHPIDLDDALSPRRLEGIRIGVVRTYFGAHPKIDRLIESRLAVLRDLGATLVDPVAIPTDGGWSAMEMEVLLYEFKHDLNAYLATLGPDAPVKNLEEVIAFNEAHADRVMPYFGQELMERAQAKGTLDEPEYLNALAACRRLTRDEGLDAVIQEENLDALVAPTGGPAWLIDPTLGDLWVGGRFSSAPAVAGYPHITVPAGLIEGLPVGMSFVGPAWSEAALIRFAHTFEQANVGFLRLSSLSSRHSSSSDFSSASHPPYTVCEAVQVP